MISLMGWVFFAAFWVLLYFGKEDNHDYMYCLILAIACLSIKPADSAEYEITYYVVSKHIESKMNSTTEYNSDHCFIGIEYRTGNHGYAFSSFCNSYYKQSYLIDYARYWQPYTDIEFSARIGGVTGYGDEYKYCGKVCPMASVGIAYTANKYIIPKLSFAPGVFVLTFSMRF